MGTLKIPLPVKLICAITYTSEIDFLEVCKQLEARFGPIDQRCEPFAFNHTNYYEKEMGKNLLKEFLSFRELIASEQIAAIKIQTNLLEKRFSKHGSRLVNLDPGYIEKAKLILATTKNYSHRIYLGCGIFGDVQLRMKGGKFQVREWTYPDYQSEEVIHFFKRVRDKYCKEVDEWQTSG